MTPTEANGKMNLDDVMARRTRLVSEIEDLLFSAFVPLGVVDLAPLKVRLSAGCIVHEHMFGYTTIPPLPVSARARTRPPVTNEAEGSADEK